jgi:peptidyl-prolyl cis-trans isomerase D
MLSAFRRLSKSAVGTMIMVLFLLTILASFAIADMSGVGSGQFGSGGGALVRVGDERITDRDVDSAMRRLLTDARQQNPEATYATIANQFGPLLDSMIDERALLAFAADHGFVLSKRLVDAEIANLPQTRGLDGKFSEQAYGAFLQQQQMTDADVRRLLQLALTQRLVLAPAVVNARVPLGVARPYAAMLLERRDGQIATVPASLFRAGLNPSDGDLQSYYAQNSRRYMVPEQRVLRVAKISAENMAGAKPSEAEIAAYYKANQATYGGSETRVISRRRRGACRAGTSGCHRRCPKPGAILRSRRRRRGRRCLLRRQGRDHRTDPLRSWLARHQDRGHPRRFGPQPGAGP